MESVINDVVQQSSLNAMKINGRKPFLGPIIKTCRRRWFLATVERVTSFKLLGVHVSNVLKWAQHIYAISSKAASRLYFLKQLRRSGASHEDLLCFHSTVLRPVLEYASPVWHPSLTSAQTEVLETLQRRAMKIIYSDDRRSELLVSTNCDTVRARRQVSNERFFSSGVFSRVILVCIACCRKCVTATSLINCVMRKHLNFYQHEQQDFVNHS